MYSFMARPVFLAPLFWEVVGKSPGLRSAGTYLLPVGPSFASGGGAPRGETTRRQARTAVALTPRQDCGHLVRQRPSCPRPPSTRLLGRAIVLTAAVGLDNRIISIEHRESEREVPGQDLLFVTNVRVSLRPSGEAIPAQGRAQGRGSRIALDIVRRKVAKAIDKQRDRRLPTTRILGIQPAIHDSSKSEPALGSDLHDSEPGQSP